MLGLILVIIAIVLAVVDYAVRGRPYYSAHPWLLHAAVIIGFLGVIIGVTPISTH